MIIIIVVMFVYKIKLIKVSFFKKNNKQSCKPNNVFIFPPFILNNVT